MMITNGLKSNFETDVVIIGAGIAGCAAAISSLKNELRVLIVETKELPRHRPGETYHPGAESIFDLLGVTEDVKKYTGHRHVGQLVEWGQRPNFQKFGEDENGPWLGFQIKREFLDNILMKRALDMGAVYFSNCAAKMPIIQKAGLQGVETTRGLINCKFIIDASGSRSWLTKYTSVKELETSPKLYAFYGYVASEDLNSWSNPTLTSSDAGWTWISRVSNDELHWMQLKFPINSFLDGRLPEILSDYRVTKKTYKSDVTWRITWPPCSNNCFSIGDAALRLDPLSSHGNLRALITGIYCSNLITEIFNAPEKTEELVSAYKEWILEMFKIENDKILDFYRELDPVPDWVEVATKLRHQLDRETERIGR